MLLHGDGTNAAQNNTFLDGSTNNFTVTRNGNTTQGSFNPFVSTYPYAVATNGGSGYFDGTGDYLSLTANAAFTIPSSTSFTIEAWIYITNLAYPNGNIISANQQASSGYLFLYNPTLGLRFYGGSGAVDINQGSVTGWTANTWYHVAAVRNGASAITLYRNGVSVATGSYTSSFGTGPLYVGGSPSDTAYMNGYISNFRLVNGAAVYTTAFTPPTAPLTAVTNTALLLGMSNGAIYDNTMLNNLETVASAQISTSVFKYGTGALKFNGTTDYLVTSPANQAAFAFGSGDFTIEMWVYTSNLAAYQTLIDTRSVDTTASYGFFIDNAGKPAWYDGSGFQTSSTALTSNTWTHVAAVRTSGVLKLFLAGVQVYSAANTNLQNPTGTAIVGRNIGSSAFYNGYIDDIRITKGIARYTTTFTPPTAAFPNSGGVQLVDYAVVAGGGGGGSDTGATLYGGGGGAGGYKTSSAMPLLIGTTYTITVGAGGAGGAVAAATNGSTSTLAGSTTVSCTGGGAGGASKGPGGVPAGTNGSNGGSGGGGGCNNSSASSTTGGTGISGQGFAGGLGSNNTGVQYGGGGGGAGGVGADGNVNYQGGAGVVYVGTGLGYSTGGDGRWTGTGASNTGNGGGAASAGAGAGGSGVVVFRTTAATAAATSTTGSPTITVFGGYRTYTFTASGTITF